MYPGVHSRILTLYAISGCISTFVILITECKLKKQTLSGVLFLMYLITSLLSLQTPRITLHLQIPARLRYHLSSLVMAQDRGMLVRISYYSFMSGNPEQKNLC